MKLLAFHNQFVAELSPDDQNRDVLAFHIVQGTQVSCAQFELNQRIGPQTLDGFGGRGGLVLKAGHDSGFQDALFPRRQRSKLPIRVLRDGDFVRHAGPKTSRINSSP